MLDFLGLIVPTFFLVILFLPVWSFIRLARVSRELEELREVVVTLQARLDALSALASAAPPAPPAAPAAVAADIANASVVAAPASLTDAAAGGDLEVPPVPFAGEGAAVPPETVSPPQIPIPIPVEEAPDLETRIGGRWLLYTGVLVLLLGVSFFLKYAFDNEWIGETARVVIGMIAGIALIAGGHRFAGDLRTFGQALMGTGLAVLYLAIYAALNFYGLIGRTTAFVVMLLVTVTAALLADRQRAQALAFIAVGGGFLTPFLVGGGEDAQLTLFTYDALLVAGTLILTLRNRWPALVAMSYIGTVVTLLLWAFVHYSEDQWLRTVLFLTLFCVLFLQILRALRSAPGTTAAGVRLLLWTAPVLYHAVAIAITASHPPAFHVYIIAFTCVGLFLTADPHRGWIRLALLLASYAPLFGTFTLPDGLSWMLPNVVTIVAVSVLHTMGILDRSFRQEEPLALPELVTLHAAGIGLFGMLLRTLQPVYPDFRGGLAAIVALGAIVLWQMWLARDRIAALNAAALAFTLAAIGIAVQFDGPSVVVGWAAEGAAAAWFGLRAPSVAFQAGGLALWGLSAVRLLDGYFDTPFRFTAIFNARSLTTAFVVLLGYGLAFVFNRYRDQVTRLDVGRVRAILHIAASLLTLLWVSAEIGSYWEVREEVPQAYLFENLMLSLGWGLYGAILITFGMWRGYAPVRYIGMTVLGITILKVFFRDLWELGGIYRVIGFLAFGVLLVLVSYLYQRRRGAQPPLASPAPASKDAI